MRELVIMADGVRKENWEHTSSILALITNLLTTGSDTKRPSDFNPYYEIPVIDDLSILKNLGFTEVKE